MQAGKKHIIIGSSALLVIIVSYSLFLISKSRTFQFFGELYAHVQTDKKVIALTFDDAPSQYSSQVIEILNEKQVTATFYAIGKNIEEYPAQAKAIAAAGMEIGNHSYSHERFILKSLSFIDSEIQKTNHLIRTSGYAGDITFRPPYGKKLVALPWYLKTHGMKTVMCDVEAETYAGKLKGDERTEFLVNYTLEHAQKGSIILLHPFCDSCANAREALPRIIDGLLAEGYVFVTVSELLTQ